MLDIRTLDLAALPSVPFEKPRQLPQTTGVYCCLSATMTALYIGSSWNIRRRWYQQEKQAQLRELACISIAWIACTLEDMLVIETALIEHWKPVLNSRAPFHNASRSHMLERYCRQCGTVFYIPSAVIDSKHRALYCSIACYRLKQRTLKRIVACQHCGETLKTAQGLLDRGLGKYCSLACSTAGTAVQYRQRLRLRMWTRINKCIHLPFCLYCCWTATGKHDKDGYPQYGNKRLHRVIWEIYNQQKLPTGTYTYVIRHLCSNPGCVNPWHLTKGTYKENTADARIAGHLPQGIRHYRTKFQEQDIVMIRTLRAEGITANILAQRFQCSVSAIQHIVKYRCWRHVP